MVVWLWVWTASRPTMLTAILVPAGSAWMSVDGSVPGPGWWGFLWGLGRPWALMTDRQGFVSADAGCFASPPFNVQDVHVYLVQNGPLESICIRFVCHELI